MQKKIEEYSDTELYYMLCDDKRTAESAFAELYARLSGKVYAYCLRFLGDKEEARDIFQETFVKFHQSADKEREMTNVPGFLMRIARNLCINAIRKDNPDVPYEDYMGVYDEEISRDKKELLGLIKKGLQLMPEEYREYFVLREYDGFTYNEIAEIMNTNVDTVKVKIFRAKKKMREILAPYLKELTNYR
jgi:RNA polymerase sigma-70 factor (ECF subfamily)